MFIHWGLYSIPAGVWNGRRITNLAGLRDSVRGLAPGTPVTLQIQREGRLMFVSFIYE